jgi:hypothetical protein
LSEITVHKFDVPMKEFFEIQMPVGANILSVHEQHGDIKLWAIVNANSNVLLESRKFFMVGTGAIFINASKDLNFIGTVHLLQGNYVFHIFEVLS